MSRNRRNDQIPWNNDLSKDFVVSPVSRHFPYSRGFVISRHFHRAKRQIELKMGSYNTYSEWWGLDVLTIKWQRHQENTLIIRMSIHRHHHMYQYSSNSIIMIVILTMHVLVILLEMCLCYMVTCYQVSMTPAVVYNTCAQVLWTPARRCYWHLRAGVMDTCAQVL